MKRIKCERGLVLLPMVLASLAALSLLAFAQTQRSGKGWVQRTQALINIKTTQGDFQSALYFVPADFEKLKDEEIDAQVKKLADDYVAFVVEQSSKPPVIPTKEELKESATAQVDQVEKVVAQLIAANPAKEDVLALIEKLEKQVADLKAEVGIEAKPAEVIVP